MRSGAGARRLRPRGAPRDCRRHQRPFGAPAERRREAGEKARRLFETQESVLVTDVVLAETIWTLTAKRYRAGKEQLAAVHGTARRTQCRVRRHAVWSTLNALPVKMASGLRTADLADALVVNKAKITAQQRNEPYRGTYTYDQAAALALDGMNAP